ncbi:hypothetical protein D1872_244600 [compost metagenome]
MLMTSKPSITASRALIGSTSVTITLAPIPLILIAIPLPTQPYPATTTFLPAMSMLVALNIPSTVLCPVPYLLSNRNFVYASFTAITGYRRRPDFSRALSLITPVVVSSVPPMIFPAISLLFSCMCTWRSPPSSTTRSGLAEATLSIAQKYSSSLIPLQAKTFTPSSTRAAATSSWVESGLLAAR